MRRVKMHVVHAVNLAASYRSYADVAKEVTIVGVGSRSILRELDEKKLCSTSAVVDYLEREFGYKFVWACGSWLVKKYGKRRKRRKEKEV